MNIQEYSRDTSPEPTLTSSRSTSAYRAKKSFLELEVGSGARNGDAGFRHALYFVSKTASLACGFRKENSPYDHRWS